MGKNPDHQVEMVPADNGDENVERGNWGNKADFILSCLGYAVGLGNVWRFPYLTFRNGGGAFLIPYFLMLLLAGLPIFFLEVSFGQYCSEGPITAWRSVPMFRGIGYGMLLVSFYVGISYNIIITYSLYYLFSSFTSHLPWIGCDHDWNTEYCSELYTECVKEAEFGDRIITNNGTCANVTTLSDEQIEDYNISSFDNGSYDLSMYKDPLSAGRRVPSEEFWKNGVLREADNMNETGGVIWQLALTLLLAWLIVFLCLVKGIKSSGKVVWVTATFPYLVLFILLIRGVTLPGASDGISFYITPRWETLGESRVWLDAAVQIFYSLSAAWGGLLTLASYNKFHNNCYLDSLFVASANCATSFFAGFVIFSILGFMSHELGVPVSEVADGGFGLAFIAYPEAVARLPVAPLWAILFFLMLITLGLDSQFAIMETVVTAICDEFPDQLRKRKTYVLAVCCTIGYLLGFTCITNTGGYWASLIDSYAASFSLLLFAIFECVGIGWIYGVKRFTNDIRSMIGDGYVDFVGFYWWHGLWLVVTPGVLSFVVIFNFVNWTEPSYNGPYPDWARAIGWMITLSSIMWIPLVVIFEFVRSSGGVWDRLREMSRPRDSWGPSLQKHRDEAWDVHINHGTTMGGQREKYGKGGEPSVKYNANKGVDNSAYM